jgi:hypothetical protein
LTVVNDSVEIREGVLLKEERVSGISIGSKRKINNE